MKKITAKITLTTVNYTALAGNPETGAREIAKGLFTTDKPRFTVEAAKKEMHDLGIVGVIESMSKETVVYEMTVTDFMAHGTKVEVAQTVENTPADAE